MPYNANVHMAQDSKFKTASQLLRTYNEFYKAISNSQFEDMEDVDDDKYFLFQSMLLRANMLKNQSTAQFYTGQ
jgi:hypothetical protein